MAARIQSLRNGIDPVDEQSRDDLVIGDVVVVSSLDGATTYNWTLVFVPDGSTATFSGSGTAVSPGSFTVDLVGPYLVRLVVDTGLPTQSTQYVRLRAKTTGLGLCLVAAGERRDGSGIIPVDVSAEGWANEQNENLLKLEAAIAGSVGTLGTLAYNKNVPEIPNDSVAYRAWAPVACILIGVRVRMMAINTAGNYTFTAVNEATGNSVIAPATFDMNSLTAGVVQPVSLTGSTSDLTFAALDGIRFTLTSDDPGFDGTDVYVELVWNTATAGGPVVEDWATTLMVGNISGGTNPTLTPGDVMVFGTSPTAVVSSANQGRLRYNQTSGTFQTSVNGGAWTNIGGGGSVPDDDHQFEVTVFPANTINSLWFAPYDCEVVGIRVYGQTSPSTAGVYTLAVEDIDASNNLLSAATFDITSLTAATLTPVPLTGTGADLLLPAGTRVRFQFVSDNGDLVAAGLYAQIIYRSQ